MGSCELLHVVGGGAGCQRSFAACPQCRHQGPPHGLYKLMQSIVIKEK